MTRHAFFLSRVVLSLWVAIAIAFVGLLLANAPGFSPDGMAADVSSISGPAFLQWGELALFRISIGLAVAIGISAAMFTWYHPESLARGLASLASGIGVYFVTALFLGHVLRAATAAYGVSPENWQALVILLPLILGIMVAISHWRSLRRKLSLLGRILASFLICVGTFSLCWLTWTFLLTFSLQSSNVATPLLRAIAIALPAAATILVAVWANFSTRRSRRRLLALNTGIGVVGLTFYGLVYLLLLLGYAD
ncbi:MAG: hypothetical protein ACFB0E_06905 [Leptolyngbyaceae cyanobacterium]